MIMLIRLLAIILLASQSQPLLQIEATNEGLQKQLWVQEQEYHVASGEKGDKSNQCEVPNNCTQAKETMNQVMESNYVRMMRELKASELVDILHFKTDSLHGILTISELEHFTITVVLNMCHYSDYYIHRYDSQQDLELARGPQVDQEACLSQLEELVERANRVNLERVQSRDLHFHHLMDTYGRPSGGFWWGQKFFPGQYHDCVSLDIRTLNGSKLDTRYCRATLKRFDWDGWTDNNEHLKGLGVGVCLPSTCDSLDYKNKFRLIGELVRFNLREVDKDSTFISYLYCLPDEESPMRQWFNDPSTVLVVIIFGAWLCLLLYATLKYEQINGQQSSEEEKQLVVGWSQGMRVRAAAKHQVTNANRVAWFRALAITSNFRALFDVSKKKPEEGGEESVVDLSVIEGIKAWTSSYVLTGHVLLTYTMLLVNNLEISQLKLSNFFFIQANIIPAFGVNAFFAITGMLTTYLMFKSKQASNIAVRPGLWFLLVLHRYVRTMPVYLFVVAYSKHLVKFLGSGPFWDYGTSSLAQRRQCEQESWWDVLLFRANFKGPLDTCIAPSWYLANDFQFLLVTPLILALLARRPRVAKFLLVLAMVAGNVLSAIGMAATPNDLRPMASFKSNGFITYIRYIAATYVLPQYRIPSYLFGILIGYYLYTFEQEKLQYLRLKREGRRGLRLPDWSPFYKRWGPTLCALCIMAPPSMPYLSRQLEPTEDQARWIVGLTMPILHTIVALGTGFYLLLATTGHGNHTFNSFFSQPLWKPFARVGLCLFMVNVEVMTYLTQTSRLPLSMDARTLYCLHVVSLVTSYLVAVVVYLLIELPVRNAFNHFLATAVVKSKRQ